MLKLSLKSLINRGFVALLTVLGIALSVALILGVERLRTEARAGFANSASGIDLIVAARGNDVQILMATVFGVGSTGTGISPESYQMISDLPQVSWTVPLLMGDNHRGYPVIGTSAAYFDRFRHSGGQPLAFRSGGVFRSEDGAVVGAGVADAFGYVPGSVIVNAHGSGQVAFEIHDEAPFTISGVLERTGTATDRMVFVSLKGFDTLHQNTARQPADPFATPPQAPVTQQNPDPDAAPDGHAGEHIGGDDDTAGDADRGHLPGTINAIYVGLTDKIAVLSVQRIVAGYRGDALSAVMPYVALLQLWSLTGTAETALRLMAAAVAVAGVTGMVVMLSAALEVRRREFAILRSAGATPVDILTLILIEAAFLMIAGIVLGYMALLVITGFADPVLAESFGLRIGLTWPTFREALLILAVFCSGLLAAVVPAIRVYRMTLADGLSMRL
ncbi:ABC transporter permease [Roseobacter ponti]|uniref:ABC transporter permease n=1 Tax=Roseobacter ponti TaxID=1891787 RepID=A0A858SUM5_9RHOB|nr:ABC transporter permease [Roseobacter ponti]QJF51383.1 ABC transporter permease [Roseobacter ponti]